MSLTLELLLTAIVLLRLRVATLRIDYKPVLRLEQYVSRYARRKKLAVLSILLLALASRMAVLPVEPVPIPGIHDEFSYLLMADTFAHGRMTNPTHSLWQHFETFHVNQQPTYCSKFFPAQGLFLGLGQVIFGHPFWGVWLSTGLMCAAICWALQGWMPPEWAFLGGIIVALRLGIFGYWANSYWGGSVAALGGALVLGALPRIKRKAKPHDALTMAVGLGLLANSRPYEGFFYSSPILLVLALWLVRRSKFSVLTRVTHVVLPLIALLALITAGMGYYFWRTAGSPIRTPYAVYSARYDAVPLFPWQEIKSIPTYNHRVMRTFYMTEFLPEYHPPMFEYRLFRQAPWLVITGRIISIWLFFIGPALSIPICACFGLTRSRGPAKHSPKARFLVVLTLVPLVSSLLIVYFNPHYLAPTTAAWLTLILLSMRRVWISDRHRTGNGRSVVRATVAICICMALVNLAMARTSWERESFLAGYPSAQQVARASLLAQLQHETGKHLVIVRYTADHNPHNEWVYNAADIDGSKIVWAHEMRADENAKLIAYFRDRHVWLVEPDQQPPKLSSYATGSTGR